MPKVVIDIPDAPMEDYQDLAHKIYRMAASEGLYDDRKPSQKAKVLGVVLDILTEITKGTVLPEHGRLIDADALECEPYLVSKGNGMYEEVKGYFNIDDAPTILEATEDK